MVGWNRLAAHNGTTTPQYQISTEMRMPGVRWPVFPPRQAGKVLPPSKARLWPNGYVALESLRRPAGGIAGSLPTSGNCRIFSLGNESLSGATSERRTRRFGP